MTCTICENRCRGSISCIQCGAAMCETCFLINVRCPGCVEKNNAVEDREREAAEAMAHDEEWGIE